MKTFADKAINYFLNVKTPKLNIGDIHFINPYKRPEVRIVIEKFFKKYFSDSNKRIFIFGINPGRFGGGLTGISFNDPVALREECEIENELGGKKELSSKFIYMVIKEYGGCDKFYSNMFLTALYPLAILKDGKNYNYYDQTELYNTLKPQIVTTIRTQMSFGSRREFVVCLGKKNAKFFKEINDEHNFFEEIRVLDHPRYIMQYKSKYRKDYIGEYLSALNF